MRKSVIVVGVVVSYVPALIEILGAKNRIQRRYLHEAIPNPSLSLNIDAVYHFSILYFPAGIDADPTLHTRYEKTMKIPIIANTKNRSERESWLRLRVRGEIGCCENEDIENKDSLGV